MIYLVSDSPTVTIDQFRKGI